MGKKRKCGVSVLAMMLFLTVLGASFEGCVFSQPIDWEKKSSKPAGAPSNDDPPSSTVLFKVVGNVFLLGNYAVLTNIGDPLQTFVFDFDTGSDLSWVECDGPCTGCTLPQDEQYKPHNNALLCPSDQCQAVSKPVRQCDHPDQQCYYETTYADGGSSLGVLVMDPFHLQLVDGTIVKPAIAFGCGYDQQIDVGAHPSPSTAGVLALGRGQSSFISQLRAQAITKNVIGHCLSSQAQGGGYLFLGDHYLSLFGISWTPMISNPANYYISGPAELIFGGNPSGTNAQQLVFDSGSSYTYFSSQLYEVTLNMIKADLTEKPLQDEPEDETLPICWKGTTPFASIDDAKIFFTPLALSFTQAQNVQLQMPPEHYLIFSNKGNVCFGILNGTEKGLGDTNLIGDISLQDKIVVYDNERQLIGWSPADCTKFPSPDHIPCLEDHCPSNY